MGQRENAPSNAKKITASTEMWFGFQVQNQNRFKKKIVYVCLVGVFIFITMIHIHDGFCKHRNLVQVQAKICECLCLVSRRQGLPSSALIGLQDGHLSRTCC